MDRLGKVNNNLDMEYNAGDIIEVINKSEVELDESKLDGANNNIDIEYHASELREAKNNIMQISM